MYCTSDATTQFSSFYKDPGHLMGCAVNSGTGGSGQSSKGPVFTKTPLNGICSEQGTVDRVEKVRQLTTQF